MEFGQNAETDTAVIKECGRIAAYGSAKDMRPELPFGPMMFKAIDLDFILIYILPLPERRAAIAHLHNALAQNALSCPIQHVFALEDAPHAHEAVEKGGRSGAVLVKMPAAE